MKPRSALFTTRVDHDRKVESLVATFREGSGTPALEKNTSNLFRSRDRGTTRRLDVRALDRVIGFDAEAGEVEVEGMATFETFADACLLQECVPPVVPELKTITIGGAITGIGIESSSFRHGFVHESVVEMDILCGDGVLRTCRRDNEFADLFFAIPNSYGTLGYILRIRMKVAPAKTHVELHHERFAERGAFLQAITRACQDADIDFVEGVIFAPGDHVVTTARFASSDRAPSDYTGQVAYHSTLRRRDRDLLTAHDYLWRWDPDWFWCSEKFGMANPVLRALLGRWMLHSRVYWKILTGWRRWRCEERLHRVKRWLGLSIESREPVIQDVEIPIERAEEFLDFYGKSIDIRPCWVCPVVVKPSERPWTLYPMAPGHLHLNFGFWDSVQTEPEAPRDQVNRLLEREVVALGGRKSLYSTVHFPKDEFWAIHDRPAYLALKATYDPGGRFRDLWEKVVQSR